MKTPTIVPGLDREEAMALAAEEVSGFVNILEALDERGWGAPTECRPWTVRDMAGHVLGNHEGLLSIRNRLRQLRDARRHGGNLVDALSATQIGNRADRSRNQVIADLRAAGSASIVARRRVPRALRAMRTSVPMHTGKERWSIAYLDDIIYTRDTWMHRIDICRALDVEPDLTVGHDDVIVADIVREWALRHRQSFQLKLTGTPGGVFGDGEGDVMELDAVEFCRLLSGRGHAEGLLAVEVGY